MAAGTTVLGDQEICSRLAHRLRSLRLDSGLTQAEVARRTGMMRPNVARLESADRATHVPRIDTILRVAAAVGVQPSAILCVLDDAAEV